MDAAGAEPALERGLRGASVVLADPAGAQEQDVMQACRQAADWAEQRGLLATAVTLATAAALASPTHAGAAFRVGQIARRKARARGPGRRPGSAARWGWGGRPRTGPATPRRSWGWATCTR